MGNTTRYQGLGGSFQCIRSSVSAFIAKTLLTVDNVAKNAVKYKKRALDTTKS